MNDPIAPPPQYPSLIAGAIRNAQYAAAPPVPDFDANLAAAKAAEAHRELMRGWSMLAARGHAGARDVLAYHGHALPAAPPPTPAPGKAVAPQVPRPIAPAAPTVALSGLDRRVAMLQRLVNPPAPPDLF
jgi:hypothetical protein